MLRGFELTAHFVESLCIHGHLTGNSIPQSCLKDTWFTSLSPVKKKKPNLKHKVKGKNLTSCPFLGVLLLWPVQHSCCVISILICYACEVGWIILSEEKCSLTDLNRFVNIISEKQVFCVIKKCLKSFELSSSKMKAKTSVAFIFVFSVSCLWVIYVLFHTHWSVWKHPTLSRGKQFLRSALNHKRFENQVWSKIPAG